MRFNCDRLSDWHSHFCWWPTKVKHRDCRWLETVMRRKIYVDGYYTGGYKWEYKV